MSKVSVIVTAYNIQQYIQRCIQSILDQTFNDIEIIVVDDGSTDDTYKILYDSYSENNKIKLIQQENSGVQEARQNGINASNGEYFLLVDGDDWIENDAIEKLYKKSNKDKLDIVYYRYFYIKSGKKLKLDCKKFNFNKKDEFLKQTLLGHIQPGLWSKFIRKNFILKNNIVFNKNLRFGEDLATTVSLAVNSPKVGFLDDYLYNYFKREDSVMNSTSDKVLDIVIALDVIENNLKEQKSYEKYSQIFELLKFKHLYMYRVIESEYIDTFHKYFYDIYKKEYIKKKDNNYYHEYIKSIKIRNRIKLFLYSKNYDLGKMFSIMLSKIKKYL